MYSKSGWYRLDDILWAHMRGTCERNEKYTSKMWRWTGKPHGTEPKKFGTLRDAKKYVEEHGEHQ